MPMDQVRADRAAPIPAAVSCRELFDVVGDHMRRMIADAKASHEVADPVDMVWTPNLGETPQETVPTTERETELVTS